MNKPANKPQITLWQGADFWWVCVGGKPMYCCATYREAHEIRLLLDTD